MLVESLRRLIRIDDEIDEKDKELKALKDTREEAMQDCVKLMDGENVTELNVDGIMCKRDVDTNFTIDSHDWSDEQFFKWLEDNKAGDLIRIKKEVHPQTRKKFLKDWMEEENPLPPFIHDTYRDVVKLKDKK